MKEILSIFLIFTTITLFSQTRYSTSHLNGFPNAELSLKDKYVPFILSAGAGTIKTFSTPSGHEPAGYQFFGTINGSFHIYQSFYLTLGVDEYREPIYAEDWITNLDILSSFYVNIYKKKVSVILGMGGFVRFGGLEGSGNPPYPGYALSVKAQYNFENNISYGIELKNIGYMFQPPSSIFAGSFYIAVGIK